MRSLPREKFLATARANVRGPWGRWTTGQAQTARFLSLRRPRSLSPPQIPNRSSLASAYSRHSPRTSQDRHTFLASRVDPPFSGKNASGSVCAHSARSCQLSAPPSSKSISSYIGCASSTRLNELPPPTVFAGLVDGSYCHLL